MLVLGIDPGKNGGLAVVGIDGAPNLALKMPDTERDLWDLCEDFLRPPVGPIDFAYIEKVASSPQMGARSIFTFGQGYGSLRMALIAAGIPFEAVAPGKWQRAMGCLSGGDKNVTKRKAQELFPGVKVTHAIADALLIAEHGRRVRADQAA